MKSLVDKGVKKRVLEEKSKEGLYKKLKSASKRPTLEFEKVEDPVAAPEPRAEKFLNNKLLKKKRITTKESDNKKSLEARSVKNHSRSKLDLVKIAASTANHSLLIPSPPAPEPKKPSGRRLAGDILKSKRAIK